MQKGLLCHGPSSFRLLSSSSLAMFLPTGLGAVGQSQLPSSHLKSPSQLHPKTLNSLAPSLGRLDPAYEASVNVPRLIPTEVDCVAGMHMLHPEM